MRIRTYSELIKLPTFEERFEYLKLKSFVGKETFGYDRYLNQQFYKSPRWIHLREEIILRDQGLDLACEGFEIYGRIIIHHMNPISLDDILSDTEYLMNPEYLISVSNNTHQAIHYGDIDIVPVLPKERTPNDTCPWK